MPEIFGKLSRIKMVKNQIAGSLEADERQFYNQIIKDDITLLVGDTLSHGETVPGEAEDMAKRAGIAYTKMLVRLKKSGLSEKDLKPFLKKDYQRYYARLFAAWYNQYSSTKDEKTIIENFSRLTPGAVIEGNKVRINGENVKHFLEATQKREITELRWRNLVDLNHTAADYANP